MAKITMKGAPLETVGKLPAIGTQAPDFSLAKGDLSDASLADYKGRKLVLNIFPSVDTPTCAMSVRKFNQEASQLDKVTVLCVSADLPFAASRFCGAEGLSNVETGSTFRSNFGQDYGVAIKEGPLRGLLSRAVVVINEDGEVVYTEQVQEVSEEPDYDSALAAL